MTSCPTTDDGVGRPAPAGDAGSLTTLRTAAHPPSSAATDEWSDGSGWSNGSGGRLGYVLPAALACDIESVIADRQDARVSAAAVLSVVELMYQTVAWVHGGDIRHPELVSLAEVWSAAEAHAKRMSA